MMQAMNTGHEGSLTTVHANSARDALARIENMILMAGLDLPVRVIREQMVSALRLVVQLARFSDGRRAAVSVSEITALEGEVIMLQELFRFESDGAGATSGIVRPTGIAPRGGEGPAAGWSAESGW
jgi:pilus assembly protein CpaF